MRMMARQYGADYAICEVMLDKFLVDLRDQRKKNRHFLYISEDEFPVGGQLMGAEPQQFSRGAAKLVEAGFSVIDINFGCPVKKVLGRCRGGFHLSQPDVGLDIIRRTRDIVPAEIPVTLKMRRGIDDSEESRDNFFTILDGAFAAGLAAITVHGRTVEQRYVGPSNWDFLRQVKDHVGDKVILGSGDLFEAQDCFDMMRQTGVDGCTVARGAIGNPWIFQQVRAIARGELMPPAPTIHEQREVIREHFSLAEQLYGTDRCAMLMRKFAVKYSASHPSHDDVRQAFCKIKHPSDWEGVLQRWYGDDGPGQYPSREVHKVQGE